MADVLQSTALGANAAASAASAQAGGGADETAMAQTFKAVLDQVMNAARSEADQ